MCLFFFVCNTNWLPGLRGLKYSTTYFIARIYRGSPTVGMWLLPLLVLVYLELSDNLFKVLDTVEGALAVRLPDPKRRQFCHLRWEYKSSSFAQVDIRQQQQQNSTDGCSVVFINTEERPAD